MKKNVWAPELRRTKALTGKDYRKSNDSCLSKVRDDEPIFVLRARDPFAAMCVEQWASLAYHAGVNKDKVDGAMQIVKMMIHWKEKKIPD